MLKNRVIINTLDVIGYIHSEIYGQFMEHLGRDIYEGIYVGEDSEIPNIHGLRKDIIEAFKNIKVPVIRWPGGCFADEYHWKDGIGPKADRKKIVNTNWGGVIEDNSFGTHEFMEFCELVGCEPYVNGNVGSGTVQEMKEWIEYINGDSKTVMGALRAQNGRKEPWNLRYFGVGNENWGCGGNMTAAEYAFEYKKYQSFCKNYGDSHLFKIACGPNSADYNWMEEMMKRLDPSLVSGIDQHYYTMPIWPEMDSATEFDDDLYYKTINAANFADTLLTRQSETMNRYDPDKKIGLVVGEWGCWHKVEPGTNPGFLFQQNTMRDAIVAAIEMNIFNHHSDRLVMATLAQSINVLQSIILTEGAKMVKTPTYHVFDLFKNHQGGNAVYCFVEHNNMREGMNAPLLSVSASVKDNRLTVTAANCSASEPVLADISVEEFGGKLSSVRVLNGDPHDYNDFEHADRVSLKTGNAQYHEGRLTVEMPACSVMEFIIEK